MTYLFDEQALFDATLTKLSIAKESPPTYLGQPFVRDPEHPCEIYQPRELCNERCGDCESDGHYLCTECAHLKPEKLVTRYQQPEELTWNGCKMILESFGIVTAIEDIDELRKMVAKVLKGETP